MHGRFQGPPACQLATRGWGGRRDSHPLDSPVHSRRLRLLRPRPRWGCWESNPGRSLIERLHDLRATAPWCPGTELNGLLPGFNGTLSPHKLPGHRAWLVATPPSSTIQLSENAVARSEREPPGNRTLFVGVRGRCFAIKACDSPIVPPGRLELPQAGLKDRSPSSRAPAAG